MAHPLGFPWERDPNQTVDDSSLSWNTDDIAIPDSWDEGKEAADEVSAQTAEESQTEGDEKNQSEDSLPEQVSDEVDTSEDSGYAFLNTPPSAEDEDFEAEEKIKEEEEEKKETMYKAIDKADKEAQSEESTINFILNMENLDYKEPEPCTGLTCPIIGVG